MASIRQLKSRIKSVGNTKKITKAMQMVAASKMRKSQAKSEETFEYTKLANQFLTYFGSQEITENHPLFERRNIKKRMIIVIASDKGLAGAYNHNVLKKYTDALKNDDELGIKNTTIAVGRKSAKYATMLKDTDVSGVYENLPDRPTGRDLRAIVDTAIKAFRSKKVDAVDVVYTEFISSMKQQPTIRRVLPAGYVLEDIEQDLEASIYEPSADVLLDRTVYRLVEAVVYQSLLDSRASEHSMRMIAMKNATDNASDLVDDLTLEMNKERQAAVTQEISEISGGVEAAN